MDGCELDVDLISSTSNKWLKIARGLQRRKTRYNERAIVVEGVRPLREALDCGIPIRFALLDASVLSTSPERQLACDLLSRDIRVNLVEPRLFTQISDTVTPAGIMAICDMPRTDDLESDATVSLALIVDGVQDPGNLGTMIRSALGAGVEVIYLAPGTADPWAPKVIRATAGACFRASIRRLNWSAFPERLEACAIMVAEAEGVTSYTAVDWTEPAALVIGHETRGCSDAARVRADVTVGIPLANELESLNAGVAASVILFEASRQRRGGDA
jgi:RNA methyltransferase, TrmH family